jgi:ATP-dependent Clp protease adapter protein ClpS/energy-coupling factor transporter ATP-binding protein EcfA2
MTQKPSPKPKLQQSVAGSLSRGNYRNRQLLLNKVKNYWIRGVLEKSLHGRALIELDLQERLDAIECPWGVVWETADTPREILPPGTRIIDKFDEIEQGRTLVILGEPGSGKTTSLLELTRYLIEDAEQDIQQPVPAVFNLSSWVDEKQPISDWLVEELHTQYHIPKQIGQIWVATEQLMPMLDGLDEVREQLRPSCVRALNEFCQEYGRAEIVVCSRLRDYEAQGERLQFQSAIYLMPLSPEQIQQYLADAGSGMAAVKTALDQDAALRELVTTPLMLSIITLAYQGISVEDLPGFNSTPERRKHLFNAYIQRMLTRRLPAKQHSIAQSLHWLSQIAYRMSQQSQTLLLIERIQPSWLKINLESGPALPFLGTGKRKPKAYRTYTLGMQLVTGLIWGLIIAASAGQIVEPVSGLISGIVGGIIIGLSAKLEPIKPVDSLKWSWDNVKKWLPFGVIGGVSGWLSGGLVWGLVVGLSGALISGIIGSAVETTMVPNQGIWQSLKNAITFGMMGAGLCLIGGAGLASAVLRPDLYVLSLSTFTAGIVGLFLGFSKGGTACIQHLILRLILFKNGTAPWNLARFLDWAAERTFLQKVGGGYIFTHRLLQEHFAALAVENYLLTAASNPNTAQGYFQRANARTVAGDSQGAIEDYTRAIEINPNFAEAYAGRSQARYTLEDYQGAVEDYDRTVQLNPALAKEITYTCRGSSLSLVKDDPEKVESDNSSYLVILLNDDFNTFNHVSQCLMKYIPGMTGEGAWQLTARVHREGQAVVWSGRQELAALYRMQLSQAGLTMAFLEPADPIKT